MAGALALAGGLLFTHARGELDHRIGRAAVSYYFLVRSGAGRAGPGLPVPPFLAGRLGLRWRRGRFRFLRLGLRSGLRFRASLRRWTRRRTILRGILWGTGWRRNRRLSVLAELWILRGPHTPRNRRSRQSTKPENSGQMPAHVKLDAANLPSGLPGILSSSAIFVSAARNSLDFHGSPCPMFESPLPAECSNEKGPGADAGERSCPLPARTRSQPIRSAIAESDKSVPTRFRFLLSWW